MNPWENKPPILPDPIFEKRPEKPKPAAKPGLLGKSGSSTFLKMREFARKAPFKPTPTYGKPLTKKERLEMVNKLQKTSGQFYGLTRDKFNLAINKMKKEKYQAGFKHDYKRIKELDRDIKQLNAWNKDQK